MSPLDSPTILHASPQMGRAQSELEESPPGDLSTGNAAVDAGINFFDTANHYPDFVNTGRTEMFIGDWIAQGGGRRDRIILATELYQPMKNPFDGPNDYPGLSLHKIRRHLEDVLKRLKTDHIDLLQMHHIDRRTPREEIWEAFQGLVRQGKIDYAGSSNFPAWCLAAYAW